MGQEYLRVQIYFPKGEMNLYRAVEALAREQGVSMAEIARQAIREYLDEPETVAKVLAAASSAEAMDHIRALRPCRHRIFTQDGKVECKSLGAGRDPSGCVECEEYVAK